MRRITISSLAVFVCLSSVHSQDWVTEWVNSLANPDSIVVSLRTEFTKAVNSNAPNFTFTNLATEKAQTLAGYQGKVLLVNFWATNCSGCRYEMPDLSRLHEAYGDKGFTVIFLSSQDKQILSNYFKQHELAGVNGRIERNQLKRPYQMLAMPSSFIVDRIGIVRDTWLGPETFAGAEKRIIQYIEQK